MLLFRSVYRLRSAQTKEVFYFGIDYFVLNLNIGLAMISTTGDAKRGEGKDTLLHNLDRQSLLQRSWVCNPVSSRVEWIAAPPRVLVTKLPALH